MVSACCPAISARRGKIGAESSPSLPTRYAARVLNDRSRSAAQRFGHRRRLPSHSGAETKARAQGSRIRGKLCADAAAVRRNTKTAPPRQRRGQNPNTRRWASTCAETCTCARGDRARAALCCGTGATRTATSGPKFGSSTATRLLFVRPISSASRSRRKSSANSLLSQQVH